MLRKWWCNSGRQQSLRSSLKRGRRPWLEQLEDRTLLNAGILDSTFGSGGIVKPAGFTYHASDVNSTGFHSVAVQADGKVVIAGTASGAPAGVFTVSRFNSDGTPDTTFDANVIAQTTKFSAGSTDQADTAAVQADGRIVVAGSTASGAVSHFAVTRYNADGTLDTSFGSSGHVVVVFTTDNATTTVSTMAIEADGRIVVGGTSANNFALARMNTDGSQDSDFDSDGRVEVNIGATISGGVILTTTEVLSDIGIAPDGKIIAVGWTNIRNDGKAIDAGFNFGVIRFNQDGTLDKSFRGAGLFADDLSLSPYGLTGPSPFDDKAYSITFQLDGKVLVAGMSQAQSKGGGGAGNPGDDSFAVVRYNTDGSFDRTFTADGVVITDFATDFTTGSQDQANSVSVEADGKILLGGFSLTKPGGGLGTSLSFALSRYNPDGTLDQNFGTHGKVVTDASGNGTDNFVNQVFPLTGGQILAVGAVGDNPNASLALAHYVGLTPGSVQFSSATYTVAENGGSATITVTRVGGTDGTAFVNYSTTSGTAVAGADYTPTTGTLTFSPGQTSQTFTVPVRDDGVFQSFNKTFTVALSNLSGGPSLGTPTTAVVTMTEADTPSSTGGSGTTTTPGLTPNQKFVAQAYLDLLNRPVDTTGQTIFVNFLNAGGTRQAVAAAIETSNEYRTVVVNALYTQYLHRAADPSGLTSFTNFLAAGGTDEQVADALIGSPEYFQNRGGGTNDGFLNALYSDALNRPVDATGRGFDQALATGTTTAQIGALILGSTEYKQDLVQSFYQRFLRRSADAGGLNFFVNLLQQGSGGQQPIFVTDPLGQSQAATDETVIAMIVGSLEYLNRL